MGLSRFATRVSARPGSRVPWASLAISFIITGTLLRLLAYFSQGQLYLDDASLALNIASRSFADLTKPLDYEQVASIPFLWAERLVTRIAGTNEYALRAIPLFTGIAVLVLLWKVGRRALGEEGAALATWLGAFSALLMGYTTAVKQYSTDALVTLVLVWLVLDVLRAGDTRAAWWRLAAGGAAALWVSHPAVFVLAGAALALPASPAVRAVPTWRRRYVLTSIAWAGAFALIYFLVYQAGEGDAYLRGFWEPTFLSPGAPDFVGRARSAVRAVLEAPVVGPGSALQVRARVLGGLAGAAFLSGLVSIFRARGASLALLGAGPYVAVVGAAMIGKYPLTDRLLLFAAPLLFLIYASAVGWAGGMLFPRARGPALAAVLALLTFWRYPGLVDQGLHPPRHRETKTPVRATEARAPHAPVYLLTPEFECVCSVWAFYTTDWSAPDTARLSWFARTTPATLDSSAPARSFGSARRPDLIGAAARLQYGHGGRWWPPEPDAGWVQRESERIRRAANPVAWVWATERYPEAAIVHLLHGIRQQGGRLIFASRVLGATAWEVEFVVRGRAAKLTQSPESRTPSASH